MMLETYAFSSATTRTLILHSVPITKTKVINQGKHELWNDEVVVEMCIGLL